MKNQVARAGGSRLRPFAFAGRCCVSGGAGWKGLRGFFFFFWALFHLLEGFEFRVLYIPNALFFRTLRPKSPGYRPMCKEIQAAQPSSIQAATVASLGRPKQRGFQRIPGVPRLECEQEQDATWVRPTVPHLTAVLHAYIAGLALTFILLAAQIIRSSTKQPYQEPLRKPIRKGQGNSERNPNLKNHVVSLCHPRHPANPRAAAPLWAPVTAATMGSLEWFGKIGALRIGSQGFFCDFALQRWVESGFTEFYTSVVTITPRGYYYELFRAIQKSPMTVLHTASKSHVAQFYAEFS